MKLSDCLNILEVDREALTGNAIDEQLKIVRKQYLNLVRKAHPDKGGDVAVFRGIQEAFEFVRKKSKSVTTLLASPNESNEENEEPVPHDPDFVPSWEYYAQASETPMPIYRVELARSGRSKCVQKSKVHCKHTDPLIPQGNIRIGSLLEETGTYTRFHHMDCWRVPSRVWLGIDANGVKESLLQMDGVVLSGVAELSDEDLESFAQHVADKSNWARLTKKKRQVIPRDEAQSDPVRPETKNEMRQSEMTKEIVSSTQVGVAIFEPPQVSNTALEGKRVVLTGIFPEVGGGSGLSLGKDRVKQMVENLGGKVTGSISGKTDVLLVGKEPGFSKVQKARSRGTVKLLSLRDFKLGLENGDLDSLQTTLHITEFSSGYKGNSLALLNPAAAQDVSSNPNAAPPLLLCSPKKAPARKRKAASKAKRASKRTR